MKEDEVIHTKEVKGLLKICFLNFELKVMRVIIQLTHFSGLPKLFIH